MAGPHRERRQRAHQGAAHAAGSLRDLAGDAARDASSTTAVGQALDLAGHHDQPPGGRLAGAGHGGAADAAAHRGSEIAVGQVAHHGGCGLLETGGRKRLDSGCYRHVPLRNAAIGNVRLDAAQNDDIAWICTRGEGSKGGDKSCKTEGAGRASRYERLRAVIRAGG
ncbi:hypothetical protein [Cupriavidus basilensis]